MMIMITLYILDLKEEIETKPSTRILELNPKTKEPCGEPPNENKEDTINENQGDVDKKEKTETKGKSEGEKTEQLDREVKEEHYGFALYPATHKEGSGNKGSGGNYFVVLSHAIHRICSNPFTQNV